MMHMKKEENPCYYKLTVCPKTQTHTAVAPSCQFPIDKTCEYYHEISKQ
jgi:hypothetical protein